MYYDDTPETKHLRYFILTELGRELYDKYLFSTEYIQTSFDCIFQLFKEVDDIYAVFSYLDFIYEETPNNPVVQPSVVLFK